MCLTTSAVKLGFNSAIAFLSLAILPQGVGVALFGDANTANEACGQLSGVQADGRKLELVLMSPDNHISFSCKQVGFITSHTYFHSSVRYHVPAVDIMDILISFFQIVCL
jgi:hypothetical protein